MNIKTDDDDDNVLNEVTAYVLIRMKAVGWLQYVVMLCTVLYVSC